MILPLGWREKLFYVQSITVIKDTLRLGFEIEETTFPFFVSPSFLFSTVDCSSLKLTNRVLNNASHSWNTVLSMVVVFWERQKVSLSSQLLFLVSAPLSVLEHVLIPHLSHTVKREHSRWWLIWDGRWWLPRAHFLVMFLGWSWILDYTGRGVGLAALFVIAILPLSGYWWIEKWYAKINAPFFNAPPKTSRDLSCCFLIQQAMQHCNTATVIVCESY